MGVLNVRRLGYALGAEITGLDATKPLDAAVVAEIRNALLEHLVVTLPGQDLDADQLKEFSTRFGELNREHKGSLNVHPDRPGIMFLTNKPVTINGKDTGGTPPAKWHTDESFRVHSAAITFLLAKELPEVGGDTMFANMYMAYETLSPAFRQTADSLSTVQDISLWPSYYGKSGPEISAVLADNPPVEKPLVHVHEETGRKALYLDECKIRNFVGMTEEETKPFVDFLIRHATRYEFSYRRSWRVNELTMWDNRCTLHLGVPDYDPRQVRRMMRCNVYAGV